MSFNVTNTKTVTEAFNQANKDQLIPLFEDLKNKANPLQKMRFVTIIFRRMLDGNLHLMFSKMNK